MTLAIVLVIFAVIVISVVFGSWHQWRQQLSPRPNLAKEIQPIDIEAFRNLVDPSETNYLRTRLSFCGIPIGAARTIARHACVCVNRSQKCGFPDSDWKPCALRRRTQHRRSRAPVGRQRHAFETQCILRACADLGRPGCGQARAFAATQIFHGYVRLNGSAMLLGRLQNPAVPVRISAT